MKARYEDDAPALDRPRALETAALAIDWAIRVAFRRDACDPSRTAHRDMLPLPPGWDRMVDGEPMPDIVAAVREARWSR